jgi:hypothetical protein
MSWNTVGMEDPYSMATQLGDIGGNPSLKNCITIKANGTYRISAQVNWAAGLSSEVNIMYFAKNGTQLGRGNVSNFVVAGNGGKPYMMIAKLAVNDEITLRVAQNTGAPKSIIRNSLYTEQYEGSNYLMVEFLSSHYS